MEYVSLLPPELLAKKAEDKRQALIIRIVIYTFVVALIVYAFFLASSIIARRDLNTLLFEREAVERQAEGLEEYATLFAQMNNAEEVLASAMGNVPLWNEFLSDLAFSLPPGTVWLSDINLTYSAGTGAFNMRGYSYDYSYVAAMLEEIRTMEQLSGVKITQTSESSYGGESVIDFFIDAVLSPGPQFEAYEEEDS